MRIVKCFGIVIVLLFAFCSCTKGDGEMNIIESPSNANLIDIVTKTYNDSQLFDIVKFDGTINELNSRYPVECVRKINHLYQILYLGDSTVAIMTYDNLGNKVSGKLYDAKLKKSDYEDLTNGMSINEVKMIDPNGEFLFLYSGRNDSPKISTHYTSDGYLIIIEYDEKNIIKNIDVSLA